MFLSWMTSETLQPKGVPPTATEYTPEFIKNLLIKFEAHQNSRIST